MTFDGLQLGSTMFINPKEVKQQMEDAEGCTIWGDLWVLYAQGSVGFGFNNAIIVSMQEATMKFRHNLDINHVIHTFALGEKIPGKSNPLDNTRKIRQPEDYANYKYYLKVTLY